jgi:hypothetical protein
LFFNAKNDFFGQVGISGQIGRGTFLDKVRENELLFFEKWTQSNFNILIEDKGFRALK